MQLEDLFEKREKNQLMLITTLMQLPDQVNFKEVLSTTDLSRSTLIKYIEDLNNLLLEEAFDLKITFDNDSLSLSMGHEVKKEDLVQLLLPYSVKIRVLHALYTKKEISVQKMSQTLFISEATLHRQLASLNSLLEEFGIQIKNGRLRGEEHQIRYFYYQLYWLITPKEAFEEKFEVSECKGIINILKQLWANELSTTNEYRLALWFSITKKRIGLEHKRFTTLKKLMEDYQSHHFFQQVRKHLFRYLSRYALEVEEEEIMCQFIFITTMFMMSPYVMERNLGYGGPVSDATTVALRVVRSVVSSEENLSEQGLYTLNQVLGQLYFFQGALLDRPYRLEEDLAVIHNSMAIEHMNLVDEMIEEVAHNVYKRDIKQYGDLYTKIRWQIIEVISFVVYQAPQKMLIGVDLSGVETKTLPILSVLRQQLEVNRQVTLDPWSENRSFDYIISNVYNQRYKQPVYYLKGAPNLFDIRTLELLISNNLERNNL